MPVTVAVRFGLLLSKYCCKLLSSFFFGEGITLSDLNSQCTSNGHNFVTGLFIYTLFLSLITFKYTLLILLSVPLCNL